MCLRGGGDRAENAGSISFVRASRGCHSVVVDGPVILGHDDDALGTFFTDVSEVTKLR